jgi:ATP-binding cassette subfamily D (ALD) long-chain fatty acid import protein
MPPVTTASRPAALRLLVARGAQLVRPRLRATTGAQRRLATLALLLAIVGGYGVKTRLDGRATDAARRTVRSDGSRTIAVPHRSSTATVVIHPTKPTTFDAHRRLFLAPPPGSRGDGQPWPAPPPHARPGLNLAFLHQLLSLLSIAVPRWNGKEAGLLLGQAGFLLLRTYLSLVVARLDGEIVRDLVAGHGGAFLWGIARWCGVGALAAYTNAAIKFLQSKVSIAFRTRLTRYVHDLYLNDRLAYYRLANLDGGIGPGIDRLVTQDLTLFCASAAALYSSVGKPAVDLLVFNYQLYRSLGPLALAGLLANYVATATLLRRLAPPFGRLKAVEGRKEGEFRSLHARLIANAEEVAFYGGAETEKAFVDRGFADLRSWMEGIYRVKIRYNMLEDLVLKYGWSAFGYLLAALPVFLPAWGGLGGMLERDGRGHGPTRQRGRMQQFVTNKRLMLSLADAGGRIMYSIKDLSELAGHTSRVYALVAALHRVHADAYLPARGTRPEPFSLADVQGTVQRGYDGVRLEQVPIVAPALHPRGGEVLVAALSFVVSPGEHLLVSGPNGVGKSAVARVVAGLWPVYRGLVSRPRRTGADGIMFLPQRPYLSTGTLRDQVIYPHTEADMRRAGRHDGDLGRVLDAVRLGRLPDREGGWDGRKEWKNVLSGGEKQRMAVARLLYHRPRYAVVDEATSAVSSDVEGLLYDAAKAAGITLITISTRASLKRHHRLHLRLGLGDDGAGWDLERIGTAAEQTGVERELRQLRERLANVPAWTRRRREIDEELGRTGAGAGAADAAAAPGDDRP